MRDALLGRPSLLAGEDLPPEPRQQRSRDKRVKLKAAGLALFGEKGYAATSIEDIADRAGLAVGSVYQHFRSKRQLLLALMDDLLEKLERLDLRPKASGDIRAALSAFLARAFSTDVQYLGAYRAWQEATLSDAELAHKEERIRAWTTARLAGAFALLQKLPGARRPVDVASLARLMDSFFWNLLGQAVRLREAELASWVDAAAHVLHHALFLDGPTRRPAAMR